MTFLETNIFLFAVGGTHPLREDALRILERGTRNALEFVTSAEVLQEILHVFHGRRILQRYDGALGLVERAVAEVWAVEPDDVAHARSLADLHPELESRDLVHLACCLRRRATDLVTFDRALAAAWARRSRSRL